MAKVIISEKFFNTLKSMSLISPAILVSKNEENKSIQVSVRNSAKSFFLSLECPESEFSFVGENIAFLDVKEFINVISSFDSPTLSQDEKDPTFIEVQKMSTKIKYKLADSTTLPAWFEVPDFEGQDAVTITAEEMAQILKTFAITGTSTVTGTVNGTKLELEFSGDQSLHKANDYLNLEEETKKGGYSITLMKELLTLVPKGTFKLLFNEDEDHVHADLVDADYKMKIALQSMI